MSLLPAFDIGFWNAWILCIILYAASFIPFIIDSKKVNQRMEGEPKGNEVTKVSRFVPIITHIIIMPLTLIYSIFLPLKFNSWWFNVGLIIYLIGVVMVLMSSISFLSAPLGVPITSGIFSISRHPGYVGFFLSYAGIGIACASWVFLLFAVIWIVSWYFGVVDEERIMLEKYGDAYQVYMDQTPRWIGLSRKS